MQITTPLGTTGTAKLRNRRKRMPFEAGFRADTAKRPRRGWLLAQPALLVSLVLHALVLLAMFFIVPSNPNGNATFGSGNGDPFSATWIPGDRGGGGGNGVVADTVVPDDDSAGSVEQKRDHSLDTQPVKQESPLLGVVQADPRSVFDAEAEAVTTLKNVVSATDTGLRSSTDDSALENRTYQELNQSLQNRQKLVASTGSSAESDLLSAPNRAGAGSGQELGDVGKGTGNGQGNASSNGTGNGIGFFGISAKARRVVYVIDASESMRKHNAMQLARQKLWASLQDLTSTSQFQIVFFNLTNHTISQPSERPKLLPATSANLRLAKQLLMGIQPDSGTDRFAAISQAIRFDPEVIFVLTDADAPELSAKDLYEIQRANKRRAVIHVVEFGIGGDLTRDSFLKKLARENRGIHFYHDLTRAEK